MNFLELCQELDSEGGISGDIVSVAAQVGEARRVVNWIARAYRVIQNAHVDWTFLRNDVLFDTTATTSIYTAAAAGVAEFGEWMFSSGWRCYNSTIGVLDEQPVRFLAYDQFKQRYLYGSNRIVSGRPLVVTEKPDQSLIFWPIPDAAYTIIGEQYRAPHRLVANNDLPIFPAKFHDVIMYRALMFYGEFEGDQNVFTYAQTECSRILGEMESVYLPDWAEPEPLA